MKYLVVSILVLSIVFFCGCGDDGKISGNEPSKKIEDIDKGDTANVDKGKFTFDYGVFLSLGAEDSARFRDYHTIVIDAEYFTKENIGTLKEKGHIVYSYINVGSVENFRDFYNQFVGITLGEYENWEEERWVDVSDSSWQKLMFDIAGKYIAKGIDGFFVDNCDVYYNYKTDAIFNGLKTIMENLIFTGKEVIINSGDEFVRKYYEINGNITGVITGVNQETVFSKINFDNNTFGRAVNEDHEFYLDYVKFVEKNGGNVYLLEYTKDAELIKEIIKCCENNKWKYYVSDSIELD